MTSSIFELKSTGNLPRLDEPRALKEPPVGIIQIGIHLANGWTAFSGARISETKSSGSTASRGHLTGHVCPTVTPP